jgi:hypothetical protein
MLFHTLCLHCGRVNPSALCIFIGLWHIIVYCPLAHMVWHPTGIIRGLGVLDFAGEAHMCTLLCEGPLECFQGYWLGIVWLR